MDLYNYISMTLNLILGGGWFVYYKANKKIKEGEATQSQAEGWLKQQEAYHNTIDELTNHCEFIKQDRNLLREENTKLRKENDELRETISEMQNTIMDLKKTVSRLGRRIDALTKEDIIPPKKTSRKKIKA